MEVIASVRGLVAHIYEWLDPKDKKALSETSKAFRDAYIREYFCKGLFPISPRIELVPQTVTKDRCICGKQATPSTQILGLKRPGHVGMITHCGKTKCREETLKRSYERAVRSLVLDNGQGVYLHRAAYHSLIDKVRETCRRNENNAHTKYSRMRAAHGAIIQAIVKHCLAADTEDCYSLPLHSVLDNYYVTYDDLLCGSDRKQIIYAPIKQDMAGVFTVTPPAPPQTQAQTAPFSLGAAQKAPVNALCAGWQQQLTPAWSFCTFPQTTQNTDNGPQPMEY